MAQTKDQKDLLAILDLAKDARDTAYDLFSRRLDTRRNVESFILLSDAVDLLDNACEALKVAFDKATETRASARLGVLNEILVRSGRATIVEFSDDEKESRGEATVLPFRKKIDDDGRAN